MALDNRVSWRAFAHAESVIVLLPTQLLFKNFNRLFCSTCSGLIVLSVSSETKQIDDEASWLSC